MLTSEEDLRVFGLIFLVIIVISLINIPVILASRGSELKKTKGKGIKGIIKWISIISEELSGGGGTP